MRFVKKGKGNYWENIAKCRPFKSTLNSQRA